MDSIRSAFDVAVQRKSSDRKLVATVKAVTTKVDEQAEARAIRLDEISDAIWSTFVANVPGGTTGVKAQRASYGKHIHNQAQDVATKVAILGGPVYDRILSKIKQAWLSPKDYGQVVDLLSGKVIIEIKTSELETLTGRELIDTVKAVTGRQLLVNPKSKAQVISKASAELSTVGFAISTR